MAKTKYVDRCDRIYVFRKFERIGNVRGLSPDLDGSYAKMNYVSPEVVKEIRAKDVSRRDSAVKKALREPIFSGIGGTMIARRNNGTLVISDPIVSITY